MFKRKARPDLSYLLTEIEQLKEQAQQDNQHSVKLTVSSDNTEVQQVIDSMNEVLGIYQEKYAALETKHKIVTELNGIGTWDGKIADEDLTSDSKNQYNSIFRTALGYEDEQDFPDILNSWSQSVSDVDKDGVNTAFGTLLANDTPYDIEYRSVNKDQSIEWVHVRAKILRDKQGKAYRHIGTLRNIHESKLNSIKVQQLLSRLELIEKSLSFSLNTLEGTWGVDLENTGTNEEKHWYSPQFKRLLGFADTSHFEPSMQTWIEMIVPEERDLISNKLNTYLEQADKTAVTLDFRLKTKDGTNKWFSMSVKILRDSFGRPTLMSGVLRDVHHDIKRSEDNERIGNNMNTFTVSLSDLAENIKHISTEAAHLAHENEVTVTSSQKAKKNIEATQAVTKLIKSISDQTNLLGLNASIEASLAGEHGKGFKVVAGEIQKLSTDTAEAVGQIDQILEDVNQSVLQIVSSIDTMSEKIQNQASVTKEIDSTTKAINQSSSELLTLIQQLS